jgi:periplasmic protein TonB
MMGKLIHQVSPTFPREARENHIKGTVLLHVIIDQKGNVKELSVQEGEPLLRAAAMEAVRQWRFQPTLLDGDPVEVETVIGIQFN